MSSLNASLTLTSMYWCAKWLQKRMRSLFQSVLKTGQPRSSVHKGFRARDNTIFTYKQERCGFTYFYCKREVLPNGNDTNVLCPERKDVADVKLADVLVDLMNE